MAQKDILLLYKFLTLFNAVKLIPFEQNIKKTQIKSDFDQHKISKNLSIIKLIVYIMQD